LRSLVCKKLTCLQTAHQVLAVFEMPDDSNMVHHPLGEWGIALDFIQDPGNLGTIIRTMNFLGIQHIYCSEDSVDVYNPKVVQASMGAIGRVKVSYVDLPTFLIGTTISGVCNRYAGTIDCNAKITTWSDCFWE
jgi:TrmH family RNA methyltransferase